MDAFSNNTDKKIAIKKLYQETLNREADEGGLNYFVNSDLSIPQIKQALASSPEGQKLINDTYQQVFGRPADAEGLKNYTNILGSEQSYIAPFEGNEYNFFRRSLEVSPEGQSHNPNSSAEKLNKIYETYLGRPIDSSGYEWYMKRLSNPNDLNNDWSKLALDVAKSDESNLRQQLGRQPTLDETHNYMKMMDAQRSSDWTDFIVPAALLTAGIFLGPEIAALSPGATGLSTLPSSVLSAAEAFGPGVSASLISPEVAIAASGAGATNGITLADALRNVPNPFEKTKTVLDTVTPETPPPTTTGTESVYDWNKINIQPNMTAVDAANSAGAIKSGTDLATQQITGGTDFTNVSPGDGFTSQGGIQDLNNTISPPSLDDAKKLADALKNLSKSLSTNSQNRTSYGVGQGYTMPNPFYTPNEITTMTEQKQAQPVYLGQLANLLRG